MVRDAVNASTIENRSKTLASFISYLLVTQGVGENAQGWV
jgi:hypothetical protein